MSSGSPHSSLRLPTHSQNTTYQWSHARMPNLQILIQPTAEMKVKCKNWRKTRICTAMIGERLASTSLANSDRETLIKLSNTASIPVLLNTQRSMGRCMVVGTIASGILTSIANTWVLRLTYSPCTIEARSSKMSLAGHVSKKLRLSLANTLARLTPYIPRSV